MSEKVRRKVAIITGGSSGIGRAAASAFAREGIQVVIAARGIERGTAAVREIEKAGGIALFVATDVSRADQVYELVRRTVEVFGRVDYAFNNAASAGVLRMTAEFSEEEFDRGIASNLKSVWLCMKYEIEQMLAQEPKGGAIVNTSSINGLGGVRQGALYAAAKSGVLALTKSAAQEYAPIIRVNALVAGAFRTPMLEGAMEQLSGGDQAAKDTIERRYAQMVPLQRIGNPEEAAEAALWLCSDAASYVTGHSMIVDGGATAWAR